MPSIHFERFDLSVTRKDPSFIRRSSIYSGISIWSKDSKIGFISGTTRSGGKWLSYCCVSDVSLVCKL